MKHTSRSIFDAFLKQGIYLPAYQLKLIQRKIKPTDKISVKILLKNNPKLGFYTDKKKAAFSTENKHAEWSLNASRAIQAVNDTGTYKFNSVSEAALFISDISKRSGITRAARTGGKAYGYLWEFRD